MKALDLLRYYGIIDGGWKSQDIALKKHVTSDYEIFSKKNRSKNKYVQVCDSKVLDNSVVLFSTLIT